MPEPRRTLRNLSCFEKSNFARGRIGRIPQSPRAWIVQTARNKAIDRLRRQTLFTEKIQPQLAHVLAPAVPEPVLEDGEIPDERPHSEQ